MKINANPKLNKNIYVVIRKAIITFICKNITLYNVNIHAKLNLVLRGFLLEFFKE